MDTYTDLHTRFNDPATNIGEKCFNHILKPVDNYKYFWKITNPKNQNRTYYIFFVKLCTMIVTE